MSDALRLTDAQRAALTSLNENRVLLSGAGCGKTFVLARRFTDLLLQTLGRDEPARALLGLVALTFTEKAALEMQQRIRRFLRERLAEAGSDDDRAILRQWLEALPEARISTIHSFCLSLLRGHAIEAGLDPDFSVAAETIITGRMEAQAAEEAVLAAVEADDADVARLLAGSSFDLLVDQVRKLLHGRAHIDLDRDANPQAALAHWQAVLEQRRAEAQQRIRNSQALRRAIAEAAAYTCNDPTDKLFAPYQAVLAAARKLQNEPLENCVDALETLKNPGTSSYGGKKAWGVPGKQVRDALKAIWPTVQDNAIFAADLNEQDKLAAEAVATVLRLTHDARRRYGAAKRRRGMVDFADLIVATRNILQRSPELGAAIGKGISQILIDEAQDTDAVQLGLLLGLLDGADNIAQLDDGRLFLVGDAKQSIYRFRGAQVEVFEQLCEAMGRQARINLDISFRTHPAGVAFVNAVFEPLLGETYSPIEAHRQETPPQPSVEILLAGDDDPRDSDARQAAVVADHIETMLRERRSVWDADAKMWRPMRPGDIAILFSRMTVSGTYERELQKRGVDYYVVAGSGFFRQQEVYDVLNALRVIDNPFDDVAFFGVLRSQFVGLDDNALMHIARTTRRPYLPSLEVGMLGDRLSAAQRGALEHITSLLRRLGGVKDAMKISELVQAVLDATGAHGVLLSQGKGLRMAGNVQRLLAQARKADGEMALAAFVAQMDDFTLHADRYEQASTVGEGEDVVRLMTIHKAKGLEFPVVVVPDLNASRRPPKDKILHRMDWGLTTSLQPDNDDEAEAKSDDELPRSHAIAREFEARDERREMLRKYYVALTRHRDYLVLVGDNSRIRSGRFRGGECFLNDLDRIYDLSERVDAERPKATLNYGKDPTHQASVTIVEPPVHRGGPRQEAPGEALLSRARDGGHLGELLCKTAAADAAESLELLGPLPPEVGQVELATTALAEFDACPALYHWRYELRAPTWLAEPAAQADAQAEMRLDPLTFGTLLHRCMELLDVHQPARASWLVTQAAADLELADAALLDQATQAFAPMLEQFLGSPLAGHLREAEAVYHELDFTTTVGAGRLRGQIDLLYRHAGEWHVVDYKTDRVHGNLDAKRDRYELQLAAYADAVQRFAEQHDKSSGPIHAGLYFLRTGQQTTIDFDAAQLVSARQRLAELTGKLILARRRGEFPRCERDTCDFCRQDALAHISF